MGRMMAYTIAFLALLLLPGCLAAPPDCSAEAATFKGQGIDLFVNLLLQPQVWQEVESYMDTASTGRANTIFVPTNAVLEANFTTLGLPTKWEDATSAAEKKFLLKLIKLYVMKNNLESTLEDIRELTINTGLNRTILCKDASVFKPDASENFNVLYIQTNADNKTLTIAPQYRDKPKATLKPYATASTATVKPQCLPLITFYILQDNILRPCDIASTKSCFTPTLTPKKSTVEWLRTAPQSNNPFAKKIADYLDSQAFTSSDYVLADVLLPSTAALKSVATYLRDNLPPFQLDAPTTTTTTTTTTTVQSADNSTTANSTWSNTTDPMVLLDYFLEKTNSFQDLIKYHVIPNFMLDTASVVAPVTKYSTDWKTLLHEWSTPKTVEQKFCRSRSAGTLKITITANTEDDDLIVVQDLGTGKAVEADFSAITCDGMVYSTDAVLLPCAWKSSVLFPPLSPVPSPSPIPSPSGTINNGGTATNTGGSSSTTGTTGGSNTGGTNTQSTGGTNSTSKTGTPADKSAADKAAWRSSLGTMATCLLGAVFVGYWQL